MNFKIYDNNISNYKTIASLNELVGLEKVKKVLYDLVDVISLKENLGAKLVGKKTYGKNTIQNNLHLSENYGIKYTVSEWFTSKEKSRSAFNIHFHKIIILTISLGIRTPILVFLGSG